MKLPEKEVEQVVLDEEVTFNWDKEGEQLPPVDEEVVFKRKYVLEDEKINEEK